MNLYGFSEGKLLCIGIMVILMILIAFVHGRQTVEYFGNWSRSRPPVQPPVEKRKPSWTTIQPSPPIMPPSPDGSILLP